MSFWYFHSFFCKLFNFDRFIVFQRLDKRIRDNLRDPRNNLFTTDASLLQSQFGLVSLYCCTYFLYSLLTAHSGRNRVNQSWLFSLFFISFQRPLLILLDRNVDVATPLHHPWTYQALVHDVLVCLRCIIRVSSSSSDSESSSCHAQFLCVLLPTCEGWKYSQWQVLFLERG